MRAENFNLEKLINKCTVGLVIVDDGRIVFTNKYLQGIVGYTGSYLKGQRFTEFFTGEDKKKVKEYYEARLSGRQAPKDYDIRVKGKGGELHWVNILPTKIRVEGKDLMAYFVKDITKQRELIKNLRESRNHYELIINHMPFIAFTLNLKGEFINGNRAVKEFLGLNSDELVGKKFSSVGLLSKKQLIKAWTEFRKNLKGEVTKPTIYEANIKGKMRLIELIGIPLKENGKVIAVLDVGEDVTKEKRLLEKLKKNEKRFRNIFEVSPSAIIISRLSDGLFINVNQAALDMTGYKREDVIGKKATKINLWSDLKNREELVNGLKKKGFVENLEVTINKKDGSKFIGLMSATIMNINDEPHVLSVTKDITERKKVEDQFKRAISNSPYPIMIHAEDGEVIIINNVWTELTGYQLKEIPTIEQWTKRAYGKKNKLTKQVIEELFEVGERTHEGEFTIKTKDGRKIIWDFSSSPLGKLPDGRRLIISTAHDVTKEERLLEKLKYNKDKYEYLHDNALELLITSDLKGKILGLNKSAINLLKKIGLKPEDVLNHNVTKLINPKIAKELLTNLSKELRGEETSPTIIKLKGPKGYRFIELAGGSIPLKDEKGKVYAIQASGQDVTERVRKEEELKRSEEKYSTLFNQANDAILILELNGRIKDVNESFLKIFKDERKNIIGKKFSELSFDYNISDKKIISYIKGLIKEKGITGLEIKAINKKTKKELYLNINANLIKLPEGRFIQIIIHDVTEQKRIERALRDSEEKFKAMIENARIGVVLGDSEGNIIEFNPEAERIYRLSKEDALNKKTWDLTSELNNKISSKLMKKMYQVTIKTGRVMRKVISTEIHRGGETIYLNFKLAIIKTNKGNLVLQTVSDVTQQKKQEEELQLINKSILELSKLTSIDEVFERLTEIIQSINKGSLVVTSYLDSSGLIRLKSVKGDGQLTNKVLKLFNKVSKQGINPEAISKRDKKILTCGELIELKNGLYRLTQGILSKKACNQLEKTLGIKKTYTIGFGREKPLGWVSIFSQQEELSNKGLIETIVNYSMPLISKLNNEELLRQEKNQLSKYLNTAPVLMLVLNKEGRIELINKEGQRVLEGGEESLIGKEWFNFIPKEEREIVKNVFKEILEGKKIENYENHIISLKGNKRLIKWHNKLLKDMEGNIKGVLSSGEDITESRRQEQELKNLRQKEELEQVRKNFLLLVTHELKQPLTPIMGYADLLKEEIVDVDQLKFLDRIINGAQEMYELITKIVNLMRLETGQLMLKKQKISLKKLVNESLRKKASFINLKSINLKTSIKDAEFEGDELLLKDVLVNLIDNAVKFSDEKGLIEVSTKVTDKYVTISVRDEGPGIRKEDQKKLFKTFSQTIEGRKKGGFGIGLSMVKMVVEKHKGTVSVDSEYGKGSKFTIKLPRGNV